MPKNLKKMLPKIDPSSKDLYSRICKQYIEPMGEINMTKNDCEITIPFKSVGVLESPNEDKVITYHLYVNANDVPAGLPSEVNPRKVNTKKKVYGKIVDGYLDSDSPFYLNNRGILISVKNVHFNGEEKFLTINIGDGSVHDNALYGVIDGGHTYHAVINERENLSDDQFVHLEIVTSVNRIDELAAARNTSVQVSDKAIAELANRFEFVKKAIEDTDFADRISYKENEIENKEKDLDATDLLRLMYCFNIYRFNGNEQPVAAYNGKSQVQKDYLDKFDKFGETRDNDYYKLAPLLKDFAELYDLVDKEMVQGYKGNGGSKFGKVKGVEPADKLGKNGKVNHRTFTTLYSKETKDYKISAGFIYPILASFRALLAEDSQTGELRWEVNPKEIWPEVRNKLVNNTVSMSRELGNQPAVTGKSQTLWSQNFDVMKTAKLEAQIRMLKS